MLRSTSVIIAAVWVAATGCGQADSGEQVPADQQAMEAPDPAPASGFDQTMDLQGITFHVTSPNSASGNMVTVATTGLSATNEPMISEVDGMVTGAEVADLDANGSPEVYIYTSSGDAMTGGLVAWAANNGASLSQAYLPPISGDAAAGYGGHDEWAVVENRLVRRFPVMEGDARTGTTRQLQYKLVPGEAGWRLEVDRTTEY